MSSIIPALVGRSELERDLGIEPLGSTFGIAGLRLRFVRRYDLADIHAAHDQAAHELKPSGHAPDAYALLRRGDALELCVPAEPGENDFERARAQSALGLEPDFFQEEV